MIGLFFFFDHLLKAKLCFELWDVETSLLTTNFVPSLSYKNDYDLHHNFHKEKKKKNNKGQYLFSFVLESFHLNGMISTLVCRQSVQWWVQPLSVRNISWTGTILLSFATLFPLFCSLLILVCSHLVALICFHNRKKLQIRVSYLPIFRYLMSAERNDEVSLALCTYFCYKKERKGFPSSSWMVKLILLKVEFVTEVNFVEKSFKNKEERKN